jgi:hypothetical protein
MSSYFEIHEILSDEQFEGCNEYNGDVSSHKVIGSNRKSGLHN